jgi:hypothetical protein
MNGEGEGPGTGGWGWGGGGVGPLGVTVHVSALPLAKPGNGHNGLQGSLQSNACYAASPHVGDERGDLFPGGHSGPGPHKFLRVGTPTAATTERRT